MTVTLKDRTIISSGDVNASGGPENPMSRDDFERKFRTVAEVLPEPRQTALLDMRDRMLQPGTLFAELADLVQSPIADRHA